MEFPIFQSRKEVSDFIHASIPLFQLYEFVGNRVDGDPGHDMSHFLRVALWTAKFGEGKINPRHIVAAALLHDIVNIPKHSSDRSRASEFSSAFARDILPRYEFSLEECDLICDAIRDHSFSRGTIPVNDLGKALQDADRLEALGSIGLARLFSTGARMQAQYFHNTDPWALDRELDDTRFSVDHFFKKLFKLPDLMNTQAGKAEAIKRKKIMDDFLISLGEELGEEYKGTL